MGHVWTKKNDREDHAVGTAIHVDVKRTVGDSESISLHVLFDLGDHGAFDARNVHDSMTLRKMQRVSGHSGSWHISLTP
jgi:hypothetical protein